MLGAAGANGGQIPNLLSGQRRPTSISATPSQKRLIEEKGEAI